MDTNNEQYTVILQDRKFTLTQSQVEFDGPNYFSTRFLGSSRGSQTRQIKLNRDPDLFMIILNYLSGYTVLPLSAKQIPEHMSPATVLSNLRSDAVFYQLNGLAQACQEFVSNQTIQQRRTYMAFVSAPLLPSHTHKEAVLLQAKHDCYPATISSDALSGTLFDFLGRSKSGSAMTFDEIRLLAVVEEVLRSKLGSEYPHKWQLVGWDATPYREVARRIKRGAPGAYTSQLISPAMTDSLKTASANLQDALEQYLHACNELLAIPQQGHARFAPFEEDVQQINTELVSILSHEEKIREARLTMTRARGLFCSLSPINSLPPEVLTRIFEMVVDSQPCICGDHLYPDILSQVCSRWRHIAHSHPLLWVHIDFIPNQAQAKLMSRAKTYVERAHSMPLEIHIIGTEDPEYLIRDLVEFLEPLAERMKALDIVVAQEFIGKFYARVFETLIPKSNPSVFTRFGVSSRSRVPHANIWIKRGILNKDEHNYGGSYAYYTVDVDEQVIEQCFASLKSLSLCGIFRMWWSKAYRGLIELRLMSSTDDPYSAITEQDLVSILNESPGLRTLQFSMGIVDQHPGSDLEGIVTLSDLEELEIFASYKFQMMPRLEVASLLRLLAPGNKPLSLKLQTMEYSSGTSWEIVKKFLARSRVTKFQANAGAPLINELLHCTPHLTKLVFLGISGDWTTSGITADALKQAIRDVQSANSPLAPLTIRGSAIYLYQLRLLSELYSNDSLAFHNCNIWENEEAVEPMSDAQLSNDFPSVQFVNSFLAPFESTPASDFGSDSGSE